MSTRICQSLCLGIGLLLCVGSCSSKSKEKQKKEDVGPTEQLFRHVNDDIISQDDVPDIGGNHDTPPADATLRMQANAAWDRFVALNKPAQCTGGGDTNCVRDAASNAATGSNFNAADPNASAPTVWMTYRHKTEIYSAQNPAGYNPNDRPWNSQNNPGQGYNQLPAQYRYDKYTGTSVPACKKDWVPGLANDQPDRSADAALVNLDETNQIGRNEMFAGAAPTGNAQGDAARDEKQLIRFLAKSNKTSWNYVTTTASGSTGKTLNQTNFQTPDSGQMLESRAIKNLQEAAAAATNGTDGQVYDSPIAHQKIVRFPVGTIEVKTGWRRLSPAEIANNGQLRFIVGNVRYYHDLASPPNPNQTKCYVESRDQGEVWGMVALHIIQRTPEQPDGFVFATFGHIDNLVLPDGTKTENAQGQPVAAAGQVTPTTPAISSTPNFADPGSSSVSSFQPQTLTAQGEACADPGSRLYYHNRKLDKSPQGAVCFNKRWHDIAAGVQDVNYARQHGPDVQNTPLAYYRLVGVQYEPFPFTQIDNANHPISSYYLANEVVETNFNLQNFRGAQSRTDGTLSDYFPPGGGVTGPFYNTFIYQPSTQKWTLYSMGGCMGCHGVSQTNGGDFSFILALGNPGEPEALEPEEYDIAETTRAFYAH